MERILRNHAKDSQGKAAIITQNASLFAFSAALTANSCSQTTHSPRVFICVSFCLDETSQNSSETAGLFRTPLWPWGMSLVLHFSFLFSQKQHLPFVIFPPRKRRRCLFFFFLSLMPRSSSRPSAPHDWTVATPLPVVLPRTYTSDWLQLVLNSSHPPHHSHFSTGVTLMSGCWHTKNPTLPCPPPPLLWLCPPVCPQSCLPTIVWWSSHRCTPPP